MPIYNENKKATEVIYGLDNHKEAYYGNNLVFQKIFEADNNEADWVVPEYNCSGYVFSPIPSTINLGDLSVFTSPNKAITIKYTEGSKSFNISINSGSGYANCSSVGCTITKVAECGIMGDNIYNPWQSSIATFISFKISGLQNTGVLTGTASGGTWRKTSKDGSANCWCPTISTSIEYNGYKFRGFVC